MNYLVTTMNILFIALSPFDAVYSCSIRNQSLISGLLQLGHHVDFLSVANQTSVERPSKLSLDPMLRIIEINSPTMENAIRIKTFSLGNFGNLPRLFYHHFFLFEYIGKVVSRYKLDQFFRKDYDLVISSSDPKASHVFAKHLLKDQISYKRWIQYWGDPLAIDITNKAIYPIWFKKRVEGALISVADKVIYTSPLTLRYQMQIFSESAKKMFFCPTPYLEVKNFPETKNSHFVVGYHGYFIDSIRNIRPLLMAFERLSFDFELDLVGTTDLDLIGKSNVNIHPVTGDIDKFERRSDLLVVLLNRRGTQIPGKVFHMAGTNKPILVIVDGEHGGELSRYFLSLKRYYVCNNNCAEIESEIRKIRNENLTFNADPHLSSVSIAKQFMSFD